MGRLNSWQPFPHDCRGFFYYHLPSDLPRIAAEIRFRKTSGSDPSSFAAGSDLMLPNGIPWRIPLLMIVTSDTAKYAALRDMLLNDRLISPMFLNKCMGRYRKLPIKTSSTLLYSLGQLFHLDFSSQVRSLWIVGPTGAQNVRLWYLTASVTTDKCHLIPYAGTSIHVYCVNLLMADY
jgi:hypothetical protein